MIDYLTNRDLVFKKLTNDPMFFTGVKHGSFPMILVTNPKVAWIVYPSNEPTGLSLSPCFFPIHIPDFFFTQNMRLLWNLLYEKLLSSKF